jgi:hypothetical protein
MDRLGGAGAARSRITIAGYGLYTVSLTYLPASGETVATLEPAMTAGLATCSWTSG